MNVINSNQRADEHNDAVIYPQFNNSINKHPIFNEDS